MDNHDYICAAPLRMTKKEHYGRTKERRIND